MRFHECIDKAQQGANRTGKAWAVYTDRTYRQYLGDSKNLLEILQPEQGTQPRSDIMDRESTARQLEDLANQLKGGNFPANTVVARLQALAKNLHHLEETDLMYAVALGSAFNGIRLHGPFVVSKKASDWAKDHGVPWEVIKLETPQ